MLLAAGFIGLVVFLVRPTFPNYDSYYDLVWGKALASGHLPDYNVLRPPTPHPLAEAVGASCRSSAAPATASSC